MQIKGSAVRSIPEFIKKHFPDCYKQWLHALPESSRNILENVIKSNEWYPLKDAGIIPTKTIGDICYSGDYHKGGWENGRFSADISLTGIYKFYVRIGNPKHIISRASRIFSAYYQPSEISTNNWRDKSLKLVISKFDEPDPCIDARIGGWTERALEISGCKNVSVVVEKSLSNNDPVTQFDVRWT